MKLEIGGNGKREGFVQMNLKKEEWVDIVHDLAKIPYPFSTGEIEHLVALRCLEHIPYHEIVGVISEWARLIKQNGILQVIVPDFIKIVDDYKAGMYDDELAMVYIYGGQHDEFDFHKCGFTMRILKKIFEPYFYIKIERMDGELVLMGVRK